MFRLNTPIFFPVSEKVLLIPISVAEGKEATVSRLPFKVGWMTYVTEEIRMSDPVDFLLLRHEKD